MPPARLLMGPQIQLTGCTTADLPTIASWQQDDAFLRLYDARPAYPRSPSTLSDWLAETARASNAFVFAIRLNDQPTPSANLLIGLLELDGILWSHQVGWLSIAIGAAEHRGCGYGAEALRLALGFAFQELNLYRVQLTVFAYNAPAISLYEKLGFQREGVYRQFLHRDGQRSDMYLYGLLAHEWQAHRGVDGTADTKSADTT